MWCENYSTNSTNITYLNIVSIPIFNVDKFYICFPRPFIHWQDKKGSKLNLEPWNFTVMYSILYSMLGPRIVLYL